MLNPFIGYFCDRPDQVLDRIVEGPWSFGLEKPVSVESLMNCCLNLEDNAENSADNGGLWSFRRNVESPLKTQ